MGWYAKTLRSVAEHFNTDVKSGLTDGQVLQNSEKYGKNKLVEKKKANIIVRFFMQFNDFMIMILLAAAGVSFAISIIESNNDFIDSIIILIIVSLNAILGLIQESKAEKALEALKKMTAPTSKVIRNGNILHIESEELVAGDIIVLETGDLVPADARLITCNNLKTEEAALTGESLPSEKDASVVLKSDALIGDRKNMVYSGSTVSYGRATAIVVEVGMNTEVGKIAEMILGAEEKETPLQIKLEQTGKILGIGALIVCGIIFILGIFMKVSPFEMFMTSVGLAVAAIPEGLPAIVTIMLAIGVQRMAKQNAVIRKLPAVETLGSATVICSDKTGTLTQNKMKVVDFAGSEKKITLELAMLCNNSIVQDGDVTGDPTERALMVAGITIGIDKDELEKRMPRVSEIPFDSKRKLMTTIHKKHDAEESNGKFIIITKGAPDVLLEKCTHFYDEGGKVALTQEKRREIMSRNGTMADKALRVLAIAFKEVYSLPNKVEAGQVETDLTFVGLTGMIDPPREEVREAVETCVKAGIKTVMITGDHISTATAVAKRIGIMMPGDKAMTGSMLSEMSQEELSKDIFSYSVFARVSPEHKVRIVQAFREQGAVVAMTGDGVNDAPALKAADIGCAMGVTGTDVAKGAADMILTDDNFATIVEAVKEGRGIFMNIRKSVHFLLSSNIGEILTIFLAMILGFQTPLLAIQLLWVNLVTDSLPAIALGLDPADPDIMERKATVVKKEDASKKSFFSKYKDNKGLFSGGLWQRIILEGCMIGLLSLIAFMIGIQSSPEVGRAMAFATLSISQLVHAFNMRSEKSIFEINIFSNAYLVGAFIIGVILQVSVVTIEPIANVFKITPIAATDWFIVVILSLVPIVVVELEKYWNNREKIGIDNKNKNLLNKMYKKSSYVKQ